MKCIFVNRGMDHPYPLQDQRYLLQDLWVSQGHQLHGIHLMMVSQLIILYYRLVTLHIIYSSSSFCQFLNFSLKFMKCVQTVWGYLIGQKRHLHLLIDQNLLAKSWAGPDSRTDGTQPRPSSASKTMGRDYPRPWLSGSKPMKSVGAGDWDNMRPPARTGMYTETLLKQGNSS